MGDLGGPTRGKARDAPDEIRLARKPLRKGLSHLFSVGRRVNTFYNDGLLKAVDRPKNLLVEVLEGPGSSRSRKEWWRFPSFSIWEGYSAEGTGPLASSERSLAVTSTTGCPSESGLLPGWHPKPKSKSSTAGNICQMALAGREEVQVHVTVPLAPPSTRRFCSAIEWQPTGQGGKRSYSSAFFSERPGGTRSTTCGEGTPMIPKTRMCWKRQSRRRRAVSLPSLLETSPTPASLASR